MSLNSAGKAKVFSCVQSSVCCGTEQGESEETSCLIDLETAPRSAPAPGNVLGM